MHQESLHRATLYVLRRCRESPSARIRIAAAEMEHVDGTEPVAVFADAAEFLQRLGLIDYEWIDMTGAAVFGAALTAAGQRLLDSHPASLHGHESLGDRVANVSRSGSRRAVEETVGMIVRAVANGGLVVALALHGPAVAWRGPLATEYGWLTPRSEQAAPSRPGVMLVTRGRHLSG